MARGLVGRATVVLELVYEPDWVSREPWSRMLPWEG
jgi:hypothetical protein